MLKAETLNQAYTLFLQGHSLRDIASMVGVSRSTCERWSKRYEWVDRRSLVWLEQKHQLSKDSLKQFKLSSALISEELFDMLAESIAELRLYRAGKLPKKALKYKPSSLKILATAYKQAAEADILFLQAMSVTKNDVHRP